jgi:hypothetical protein
MGDIETRATIDALLGGEEEIDYTVDPEPDEWLGRDEITASRMVHRYLRTNDEIARTTALFDAEIERMREARDAALRPLKQRLQWLDSMLKLWHKARLDEDPTATTVRLPTGTLTSAKAQDAWVYDEAKFLAWARVNAQGAVRVPPVVETIDRNEARKLLAETISVIEREAVIKATGELVPGLTIRRGGFDGRHYYVKPS